MKLRKGLWLSPLILVLPGCGYNQIQRLDENAQQAKQQISVQLQRRADLVPNLVNTVKGYAQLKADQGFLRLQDELAGTENRIATSRNDYNQAVQAYNTYIRTFPQAITAKVTGAKPRTYFEAAAGTEAPPTVDFGTRPTPSTKTPAAPKSP